jgi:DNA invertase Pin-like site-specific DNA recombinase
MRVIGYVRVSTDEQAVSGAGLEAQRAAIATECKRRSWELVETLEDAGYSAKDLKRPGVREALRALEAGEANALVVAKLDRLSRSMLDFAALMATAQKQQWALVALDCAVDTSTPAGEAMAHVLATFGQFERRLIGQRTREAPAVKRASGVRLGRPPTVPRAVVRRIQRQRARGESLRAIAEKPEPRRRADGARWREVVRGDGAGRPRSFELSLAQMEAAWTASPADARPLGPGSGLTYVSVTHN